jgi:hypothetical protein
MKAMEDENFMLKRRIEELKKQVSDLVATNEYLLSQNATLRLTNMQKESQGVSGASVVSLVSMAQPMGLTPSMSVAASQPLMAQPMSMSVAASQPLMTQALQGLTSSMTVAGTQSLSYTQV